MRHYNCPNCDGEDIGVKPILVQEIDLTNQFLLKEYEKKQIICHHCGWSGTENETVFQEV
jgi:hypothetical protein